MQVEEQQSVPAVDRRPCKTFKERKELMKQALASALRAEDMLTMFMDDPMYAEVLEDMRVLNEREGRDERSKKHKENILGIVQAVISIREKMVSIRNTKTSRRVYVEAWGEIAVSVCRTGSRGVTLPGPSLNDMLLKWRDECDAARELEQEPEVGFRVRYKGRNGDKPDWETSSDEEGAADPEEDFQVNRDTDWGDEDIDMRRKRYRRMKARSRGDDKNVPAREGKRHCY